MHSVAGPRRHSSALFVLQVDLAVVLASLWSRGVSRYGCAQHRKQPLYIGVGGPQVGRHSHGGGAYRDMDVLGCKTRG